MMIVFVDSVLIRSDMILYSLVLQFKSCFYVFNCQFCLSLVTRERMYASNKYRAHKTISRPVSVVLSEFVQVLELICKQNQNDHVLIECVSIRGTLTGLMFCATIITMD